MLISDFKARCIAELKKVRHTGQPLVVTLRGKPLVRVEAIHGPDTPTVRLGSKRGGARVKGDLVKIDLSKDWDMNR